MRTIVKILRLAASATPRALSVASRRAAVAMTGPARRFRGGAAADTAFTLVEVLVASAVAVTVFAATMAILESSAQLQARDAEWALMMQRNRVGLARMIQEIRQATKIEEANPGAIEFLAPVAGKSWTIKYECTVLQTGTSFDKCVRRASEEGKALPGSGSTIATAILNGSSVFSYSPSSSAPTVATAKLEVPAQGTLKQTEGAFTHKFVLENAAFIRNLDLAG